MDLGISGLASGFDWRSLVDQLIQVERAPEQTLRDEQNQVQQRNNAFGTIKTQLSILQTRVQTLQDPNLFESRSAVSSDATAASATADQGTAVGAYLINVSQLATAAIRLGTAHSGAALSSSNDVSSLVLNTAGFATPITAGTFTIDGQQITIATSDTLKSVFDQIKSATGNRVTASYNKDTDQITLSSTDEIVLGSATDTSNFLSVAKLYNNGSGSVTSANRLGAIKIGSSLNQANFATPVVDGGQGQGEFKINGVSIQYNTASDSVANLMSRINDSAAGVTATYDVANDRISLSNKNTGDMGIALQDVTGNFLTASGLIGGTFTRGKNLLYSVNNGNTLSSQSNTITAASSGITGLSVTALAKSSFSITVSADTARIKSAITDFVSVYNQTQALINTQTASTTDATGKVTAGLLASDPMANEINSGLRNLTTNDVPGLSGALQRLDALGFSSNGNDDSLSTSDTTNLDAALSNNLGDLKDLFTHNSTGLASRLNAFLNGYLGDNGTLISHQNNLTAQSNDIDTQISDMERIILANRQSLIDEFTQMETAQATIKQQQDFLTQQINKGF